MSNGVNQKLLIGLVVAIIVIGGGYYLYRNPAPESGSPIAPSKVEGPAAPAPTPAPAPAAGNQTHTMGMDANGFTPANLTIKKGDTVIFHSDDRRSRWPASGIHPTHLLCPGFDALRSMQQGETYSHTFTEAKECPMHDHLIPSLRGKITVTE